MRRAESLIGSYSKGQGWGSFSSHHPRVTIFKQHLEGQALLISNQSIDGRAHLHGVIDVDSCNESILDQADWLLWLPLVANCDC